MQRIVSRVDRGLFRKNEKERASQAAMQMIQDGYPNVHISILWTEVNVASLGPYVGFYASSYQLGDEEDYHSE